MEPPRVFLMCVNRLVCEAVNIVLRHEGLELVGMETDLRTGLAQIRALQPNIVLVEGLAPSEETANQEAVLMSALVQLVYDNPRLRVIRFSLSEGELRILRQEQRRLVGTQDLIAAIAATDAHA
jgi:hypothetical protein